MICFPITTREPEEGITKILSGQPIIDPVLLAFSQLPWARVDEELDLEYVYMLMNNNDSKIVLASQSPRRIELLKEISAQFEVMPSSIEEKLDIGLRPEENARILARAKAEAVAANFPDCWVIGADTLVTLDNEIFGKPEDEKDAKRILKRLSGREHLVITGISVVGPKKSIDKPVTSGVRIKPLTDQEIEDYIATGEPMDKAGAYAIQGKGSFMVRSFSGSKNNIIGLPLDELKTLLKKTYHPTFRGSYGSKPF